MDFVVGSGDEIEHSELPALEQLTTMGYQYKSKLDINKERSKLDEVLLYDRLEKAIRRLNPHIDQDGISDALSQIKEDQFPFARDTVDANEKIRAKLVGLSQSGGLEPITVEQYDATGTVRKTIRLFDFENMQNNDFLVTNQFELWGFKQRIYPDIVVFVNGIPLVIIECKSPTKPRWLEDAVEKENFKKYRSSGKGFDRLMYYNHILIATCGIKARHGTITSDVNSFQNSRWSSAHPLTREQVEEKFGACREQEILIAGMLDKSNLLDLLKNYTIYQDTGSKKIKITAKHQQYRAVQECAKKIQTAQDRHGGVVWHTQGSGKSFTMLWVAKQAIQHGNLPILIVTDRLQLTQQIYSTFLQSGYPLPVKAQISSDLDEFIASPRGKTMVTTIQKFEDVKSKTDEKIIVLVDEAHRSQYGIDANSMSAAMPNGIFFGFTGTPIDREDKSTFQVFGDLIDQYGFEESKSDGATLPIDYVGMLPDLFIEGANNIDELFERFVGSEQGMTPELKDKLKREYANKIAIATSPARIKEIASNIIDHFKENYLESGYKAMLVASSREAAVLYKKELDRLHAPQSKIIMDQKQGETGKDGTSWDKYYLTDKEQRLAENAFKDPKDPTKILIVVDMLLVGFDAPIVSVMYLDKPLKDHALLQAIARVNRPYDESKIRGLIVDYYGVTKNLQNALQSFNPCQIRGALEPDAHQLESLQSHHHDVMNHLKGMDKKDYGAIVVAFEPADKRDAFIEDFKKFSKVFNTQIYKKEAKPYIDDFKDLVKIRQVLRNAYGEITSTVKYASKIQKLIDDAIRSSGVPEIVKPKEITFENFLAYVSRFESSRARTALIKNKAQQVIHENMHINPEYFESLQQRLLRIISEEKQRRKDNADYFAENEYKQVYEEALSHQKVLKDLGFENNLEFAIYNHLDKLVHQKEQSRKLAKSLYSKLQPFTTMVEYHNKPSIQRKMQGAIYDTLEASSMADEDIFALIDKILTLVNHDAL